MDTPDFIPDNQFQPDQAPQASPQAQSNNDFIPDNEFVSDEQKYGNPVEQAKAGAEGALKGFIGPVAPIAERLAHVDPADIRGREQANPITHGAGEVAGLGLGLLTDTGEAALMTRAGEAAKGAAGIGTASFGAKIGSEAVKQAAEMAVLQGSDEVSKRILQDPDASVETALTNVGLASVLGGAFGGATGATGALWSATIGPKVEEALSMIKNHVNGEGKIVLPEAIEKATKDLGIEVDPAVKATLSNDVKAKQYGADLMRAEHEDFMGGIDKLKTDATNSVAQSLGVPLEDIAHYSENESGHELADTVKKEFDQKYAPVAEALDKRNASAEKIMVPDEARLTHYGDLLEKGMNKWGTDSPIYKNYHDWGNRLLAKDTIGGIDQIKTEIGGELSKAFRSGDTNTAQALKEIRDSFADFQEKQIENEALRSGMGEVHAAHTLADRAAANNQYRQFRTTMDELSDHLGIGRQSGYKGMLTKLGDKVSPEQLLNKFSPRGNADIIPFLQKNFPETLEKVRSNEVKRLMKGSIKSEAGESILDYKRLGKAMEAAKKGKAELVDFALSPEAQKRIAAANALDSALPNPRNSGTPAGLIRLLSRVPMSAMGSIGWLLGHGPLGGAAGALLGHLTEKLGVDAPQGAKLAYLRFLTSEAPVKAEGFKAAVDFMHNAYKGDQLLNKAATNLFKPGVKDVISSSSKLPDSMSRAKLDKLVASTQQNPNDQINKDPGHLGHYLPKQQISATSSSMRAVQYLQTLRPVAQQSSPLDRPSQPTAIEQARYNRALDIAHQPLILFQNIKNGTLQRTDLQDIQAMYPALAQVMVQKVTNEMANRKADQGVIPYKTRIGMSLFLGQPMDSTMQPTSIQAAQPIPKPMQPQQDMKPKKTEKLGSKSNNLYKTPSQAAESDRGSRD